MPIALPEIDNQVMQAKLEYSKYALGFVTLLSQTSFISNKIIQFDAVSKKSINRLML